MDKVDKRFSLISRFQDLKSFPNGISSLKQMTGGEYAEIMKVSKRLIKIYPSSLSKVQKQHCFYFL